MEGYNPKMVRERTGYRTLNRTRMLTGSGQPLFSKVQSFNIELLCCCSPPARSFYCFTVVRPQRERSDGGTATTRSTASHPPPSVAPTEGSAGEKVLSEGGGDIQRSQVQQTAGEAQQGCDIT